MIETLNSEDDGIRRLITSHGGVQVTILSILKDFFTHAFDGSGTFVEKKIQKSQTYLFFFSLQ